ncbi:hypothetical protein GHJ49_09090 [Alistipes sp. dk3620]|jgi:lipoprotein|uniref:BF3164 family lipoprotein n=1 Tax=unclassified Alistipes TaxID=2608932 RepID=UPI000E5078AF|nr:MULTISPECIES: BF3164 family lipoprotein [unclassified Alistipes]MQX27794.1 hypothetical protein [Alistipes sp. dk3620]QGA23025.1 hypothetical protein GFH31_03790 [Alistipes sp. dk3624]RHO70995.1 hypothetical protein DW082_05875 [Alistipes sp. AF48-12]
MLKKWSILLLLVAIVTGCKNSKEFRQIKSFSEFPLTDSIRLTSLQIADSLSYPTRIYDYDSLFAFKDLSRENQVILFSKKTGRQQTIVAKGRGPYELLGAWSLSAPDSSGNFYIHDVVTSEIMRVNLPEALQQATGYAQKMQLREDLLPMECIARTEDSLFVGTGRFEDCRVIKFNQKGEIKAKIGCSPQISSARTANPQVNQAYIGVVKASPNNRSYAIVCRYADQIEVFHSNDTTQAFFIKGPMLFEPKTKIVKGNVGLEAECMYGYVDLAVTDQWIIGLFSGRTLSEKRANQGNALHIFTWDGTPVARYFMDQDCISIDMANDSTLYALSIAPQPEVFSYKMTDK